MTHKRIRLSIRTQIVVFLAVTLVASLASYVAVGTRLIVRDKSSYIYDYCFSQVRQISQTVGGSLGRFDDFTRFVHGKSEWDRISHEPGFESLAVMTPAEGKQYRPLFSQGDFQSWSGVEKSLASLGWKPDEMRSGAMKFALDPQANQIFAAKGTVGGGFWIAKITLPAGTFDRQKQDFKIQLIDGAGKSVLLEPKRVLASEGADEAGPGLPPQALDDVIHGEFSSGVREVSLSGGDYLVGYDRVPGQSYFVLYWVPKEVAFVAAKILERTFAFQGICIALLVLGVGLILIQRLVHRLDSLAEATVRVSSGNFSEAVPVSGWAQDEVSDLGASFNLMTGKIQELILQTADKARMEKELEAAHAVQSQLFPAEGFADSRFQVCGKSVPASECGGDWWSFARVDDELVVIMGDVTGHGVPAALVTASVHSVFHTLINGLRNRADRTKPLDPFTDIQRPLFAAIEEILRTGIREHATFPLLLASIHLPTGRVSLINAGHPSPFFYDPKERKFNVISGKSCLPAGMDGQTGELTPIQVQCPPDSWMVWYTDGLFESRPSDQAKLNKKEFMGGLTEEVSSRSNVAGTAEMTAPALCDRVVDRTIEFFGKRIEDRPDDITVVVMKTGGSGGGALPSSG